ncbi:hypothetical protein CH313_23755, partial [Streptomyces sp. TSRI0384-2]
PRRADGPGRGSAGPELVGPLPPPPPPPPPSRPVGTSEVAWKTFMAAAMPSFIAPRTFAASS